MPRVGQATRLQIAVAILVSSVPIGVPAAPAAARDGWCPILRAVVADFRNNLRNVASRPNAINSPAKLTLSGMRWCAVTNIDERYAFACSDSSPKLRSRGAALARLQAVEGIVSRCFPGISPRRGALPPNESRGAHYPELTYKLGGRLSLTIVARPLLPRAKRSSTLYDRHAVRLSIHD